MDKFGKYFSVLFFFSPLLSNSVFLVKKSKISVIHFYLLETVANLIDEAGKKETLLMSVSTNEWPMHIQSFPAI